MRDCALLVSAQRHNIAFERAGGSAIVKKFAPLTTALMAVTLALGVAPASGQPHTAVKKVTESGIYIWVDGMYQQVKLPAYGLGLVHNIVQPGTAFDLGAAQSLSPSFGGGGVRGAIGAGIPGTGTRFEFGGSYLNARATHNQSSSVGIGTAGLLMTGAGVDNGYNCFGNPCAATGVLTTNYRSWEFNAKAETDLRYGSVTVTPSLAVFGANTYANQSFSQNFAIMNMAGVVLESATYSASTKLEWRDLGARAGLKAARSFTPMMSVDVGVSLGVADRRTSFSGNDVSTSTSPAQYIAGSSSLSLGANKTVLLANVEAGFIYRFTPAISLRGFGGFKYDDSVPGIGSPSFAGGVAAPTSRSAARIVYASQTSYYGGGGLIWKFGATGP